MSLRIYLAALSVILAFTHAAHAASCWITQGASASFGTLVTGNASTAQSSVKFSCYAGYGETRYLNVCLSSLETSPFKMTSNGDENGKQYTMLFRLYSALDNTVELTSQAAGRALQTSLTVGSNQVTSSSFPLSASIPSGQNNLPVRSYFNYTMGLKLTWNSGTSKEVLTGCQNGSYQGVATDSSSQASATLSDSCFIQSVTSLNFGTVNSTSLTAPIKSTAIIRSRCPAGTRYSLGIGAGEHSLGNRRQMCNDQHQCFQYALWQDAAANISWGEQPGSMLDITHHEGNVQNFTVYGTVSPQTLYGTGVFSDNVVIMLTY